MLIDPPGRAGGAPHRQSLGTVAGTDEVGALDQSAAESTSIGLLSPLGRALLLGRELRRSACWRAPASMLGRARAKAMACSAPRLVERIWVRLAQQPA